MDEQTRGAHPTVTERAETNADRRSKRALYDALLFGSAAEIEKLVQGTERRPHETAVQWIDRVYQDRFPPIVHRVFHELYAKCQRDGTSRIELSARKLAREIGVSDDSLRIARRALSRGLAISKGLWVFPGEWFGEAPPVAKPPGAPPPLHGGGYNHSTGQPGPYEVFN